MRETFTIAAVAFLCSTTVAGADSPICYTADFLPLTISNAAEP